MDKAIPTSYQKTGFPALKPQRGRFCFEYYCPYQLIRDTSLFTIFTEYYRNYYQNLTNRNIIIKDKKMDKFTLTNRLMSKKIRNRIFEVLTNNYRIV